MIQSRTLFLVDEGTCVDFSGTVVFVISISVEFVVAGNDVEVAVEDV